MKSLRYLLVVLTCLCYLTGCGNGDENARDVDLTELLNLHINDISYISVSRNGWGGEDIQPGFDADVIAYVYEMIRECKITKTLNPEELSKFSSEDGSVSMGTINAVRVHLTSDKTIEFNVYFAHDILEIVDIDGNSTWYIGEANWLEAFVQQSTDLLISAADEFA